MTIFWHTQITQWPSDIGKTRRIKQLVKSIRWEGLLAAERLL